MDLSSAGPFVAPGQAPDRPPPDAGDPAATTGPGAGGGPTYGPPGAAPGPILGYGAASRPAGPFGFTPPGPRPAVKTEASTRTRLLAGISVTIGLAGLALGVREPLVLAYGGLAVLAGIAFGRAFDTRSLFRSVNGVVAGILVVVALSFAWVLAWTRVGGDLPYAPVLVVGAVVVGLDWNWSERLRGIVLVSGVLLVPSIGSTAAALPLAVAWFACALVSFWSCEHDVLLAGARLAPITPGLTADEPPASNSLDLVRIIAVAGIVAIVAALAIGWLTRPRPPDLGNRTTAGASAGGGSSGATGGPGAGGARGGSGGGSSGGAKGGAGADGGSGSGSSGGAGSGSGSGSGVDGGSDSGTDSGGNGGFGNGTGNGSGNGSGSGSGANGGFGGGSGSGNGSGSGSRSGSGTSSSGSSAVARATDTGPLVIGLLLLLVLVGVGVFVGPWLWRRAGVPTTHGDPTWAVTTVKRLEREGAKRGRPRRRAETVRDYAAALAGSVLPDDRIRAVGDTLSASVFGPAEPPADVQVWTASTLDDVAAAHPPPTRAERKQHASAPPPANL